MSEDDELVQLRASLVEEKKRELDAVCDAHDSMLRELFHLHKFVTLIGFDPHAAKQEKSEVWEEFRKPYDLWDQATSGPSSRRTRRAKNERRESFISSAAPSTSQTPASKKHKPPDVERALRKASMPNLPSMSPTSVLLAPKRSLDNPKPYKAKVVRSKTFAHPVTPDRPGSRKRPFLKDRDGDQEEEEPSSDSPAADDVTENIVADQPADLNSPQKRKQPLPPPVTPSGSSPHVLSDSSPSGTPLPKRIRLIVKPPPPPPIATNPAQLPRPAAFGGSLPRLLSSFALLEEGDENEIVEKKSAADQSIRRPGDVTPISGGRVARPKIGITWEEFEESVRAEVEIWKQIREAKSRGWLGCMRGWEIVRGEEDEPEEEEVEEEDAEGGDTEQELVDGEVERLVESRAESRGAEEQMDEVVGQEGARTNSTEGQIDLEVSPTGDPNLVPAEPALDQGPVGDKLDNAPPTAVESNEHVAANGDPPLAQLPGHEDAELEPTPQAADPVSYEIIPGALPDLRPHAPGVLPELGAHTPPGVESNIAPPDHIDSVKSLTPMALDYPSSPLVPEAPEPVEPAEPPVDHIPIALDMEVEIPILPATISSPAQLPTPGTQTSNLASRIPTPAPSTPIPTDPLPLPPLPFLPPSHHETLLAAIPAHSQRVRNIPLTVRHRPARLIARYWEQLQGAADRLVAAEERRVRTGARALARGVVAKAWKDAVAVIRARIREQEEAEQAREGRKHLAAILEQSSALLETQQEDLGLGRRHGGRSRSRSSGAPSSRSRSHSVHMQEDMENEDEGEGSEGSGGTDVEEEEEEGGSEMLLDAESRDASEGEGDVGDAIHEADGEDDPDVDVGDEKDLAIFRAESASATEDDQDGFGHPLEDTVILNDIFDAAPPESLDAMSVVESDIHSARGDAMSIIEGDAMSIVEDTGTPQVQEIGHSVTGELQLGTKTSDVASDSFPPPQVDDTAINGHSSKSAQAQAHSVKPNGHHATAPGISTPATPRSPVRTPMNISPIPSAPPTVRKLTLKVKSPEPALEVSSAARRRSSRRTSVSKSEAVGEDSDGEVDGLARDAEMPLEELMRRYGYVGVDGVGADQSSTPREADSDDEDEEDHAEDNGPAAALLGLEDVTPAYEGGVRPPFLLRGTLRHYQQAGMEWLISGYVRGNNGILADEMGLGKTIQTIALLAHLACDRGIWGPHLIIVPTSVILNWEMEFKKFLPGFKVLSYYGSIKERKERRVGWNTEHAFNVVVTSYQLVLADQAIFRRKKWHYMILDEAHNIKNFKSQRWATLFSFNSERRLLLTGTPLQNNITELWSLLYFVQPDTANKQQFEDWFLETMRHAVETGDTLDEQTRDTIDKLHTVLRPYILRRLKCDVEQELPSKHEHIVYCRLSKRQRYLYDEFMSRAQTKETLSGGNFLSIVNCLMQLRKVCNHPDLFEVRPILTSFAIPTARSAVVDYEIKELLVRRRLLKQFDDDSFDFYNHSFDIMANATNSSIVAEQRAVLNPSRLFPTLDLPGEPPPKDFRTIAGNRRWLEYQRLVEMKQHHQQLAYINTRRNTRIPAIGAEKLALVRSLVDPLVPTDVLEQRRPNPDTMFGAARMIKSYTQREESMGDIIDRFAFATPNTVALDIPRLALAPLAPSNISGHITLNPAIQSAFAQPEFDVLHRSSVKLQIAFPDSSLLQYDCGKLQELDALLREKHTGGHRVLIFTQMTRVLDILEIFLNFHGYRYLRLDGSTKIEQRQVVTERFNVDNRIFAFIASSRSGGVGINLTGADTVIFYDSDYNPSMDRQCEDRAHRIGQTREVSIYRFISKHTVEEAMLRKANQKRLLDDIVIQQGEFDWRQVMVDDVRMERALAEVEDKVDADAAKMAAGEEQRMDWNDFGGGTGEEGTRSGGLTPHVSEIGPPAPAQDAEEDEDEDDGLRPIERYMLRTVENDWEFFG